MPYQTRAGSIHLETLHAAKPERYPFLLASTAQNPALGRYDILFSAPSETYHATELAPRGEDFFQTLDRCLEKDRAYDDTSIPDNIPFRGGWFLFLGYELAQHVEPPLALTAPPYPLGSALRSASAIIVDHVLSKTHIVGDVSADIAPLIADVDALSDAGNEAQSAQKIEVRIHEEDAQHYLDGVNNVRDYILAGDIFQANLSRLWQIDLPDNTPDTFSLDLFAALRQHNPAPFSASCHFDDFHLISSSPERLLRHHAGRLDTRPIAGTRPRGKTDEDDKALAEELLAHGKERAEHIMLIDLERNDLGRIAKTGTVKVDEFMVLETYAHVHHIVSNVTAHVRDDVSVGEMLRAVFPGGTITGCPKVRCMEIIHEIEQDARGAYVGSVGYLNHNGDFDTNILIRSFIRQGNQLSFRAGGGTVFDSIAERELTETRNKARGLLHALSSITIS